MVVDLSKVKTSEELSSAIGGNMTVFKAEEQATPLESWKEQEYIALHNQIIAHGRNACERHLRRRGRFRTCGGIMNGRSGIWKRRHSAATCRA